VDLFDSDRIAQFHYKVGTSAPAYDEHVKPWPWYLILTILTIGAIAIITSYVLRAISDPDLLGSWIIAAGWTILFGALLAAGLRNMRKQGKS
jgi:hypothetical protein